MENLKKELINVFQEKEEVFDFFQNAPNNAIWYWNLDGGDFDVWTSDGFWTILGYTKSEAKQKNLSWNSLMLPEDYKRSTRALFQHLEDNTKHYSEVVRFKHKNGGEVLIRCDGVAFALNEGEALNRMIGSHTTLEDAQNLENSNQRRIERFGNVISGTDIGTWEWNVKTNQTIVNEKWASIIGYTLSELEPTSPSTWTEFVHPEDKKLSDKLLKDHVEGRSPLYECEIRMRHKSGHWVWILDRGKVSSRFPDGSPEWITGSHIDISRQKENELLLVKYKELLERVNNVARIGWWEVDFNTDELTLSSSAREILGLTVLQELTVEEGIGQFFDPSDRERMKRDLGQCKVAGKEFDGEYKIIDQSDGRVKWIRALGVPVVENGVCVQVHGLIQDIDEKHKAIEAIALRERELSVSFEYSPNGRALVCYDGRFLKLNVRFSEMLGYSEAELKGKELVSFLHPNDREKIREEVRKVLSGGNRSFTSNCRLVSLDSNVFWGRLSIALVRDEQNEPLHFIAELEDITERVSRDNDITALLELTRGQNKRLLNFAHIVSHNLRSHSGNLTSLISLIELENHSFIKTEQFSLMNTAIANLEKTVSHLSEVVQLDEISEDSLQECVLLHHIERAVESLSVELALKSITVDVHVPESVEVRGLPAYLDSVFLNLLSNAAKYHDESKERPYITISAKEEDEEIWVEVKDNGRGIDLDKYGQNIFHMYQTFHENSDARGIGLFITKNQVEAMGGSIEVKSMPHEGTVFTCRLKKS